jgi:Uncharacterised nucleotidyltransferase
MLSANTASKLPGKRLQIREAALLTFCEPLPAACARLWLLSGNEWGELLRWLDTSGLALYFLDRLTELQLCEMLPPRVLARLQRNLIDNTRRTRGMIDESIVIHRDFQSARLSYATLKGFSLWPYSVPKPELRSQLDLDFLVTEKSAPQARQMLERRGYSLHAISGRSWEFKTDEIPGNSLEDLYKDVPRRCIELHVETNIQGRPSLLARVENRDFHGVRMPVLSPADLFLGQGLHLYKHACSEFSRAAHLLEFRRHVLARREDDAFWRELHSVAEENPRASLALGVVTLLIGQVMGDFAPESLTRWTVRGLPDSVRLWVERYASRSVFASFPGSKLYLLLQRELESTGLPVKRTRRQSLLPLRLPPPITHVPVHDTFPARIRRRLLQLHFIFFRMRFHVVEGLRYTWESFHWRRMRRPARLGVRNEYVTVATRPGTPGSRS